MAKDPKDLNPWSPLIAEIVKMFTGNKGLLKQQMPQYPGSLWAGWSPESAKAAAMAQAMSRSGGPQAWQNAQNFTGMYQNPFPGGVFNPFSGMVEGPMNQPGGRPPMGGGFPPMGGPPGGGGPGGGGQANSAWWTWGQ